MIPCAVPFALSNLNTGGWVPVHSDKLDNLLLSLAKHISNWIYIPVKTNVCLLHNAQIYNEVWPL